MASISSRKGGESHMDATEAQRETIEMLQSETDNLEVEPDTQSNDLVFSGDGIDGPVVGYINPQGNVSWLVGG
jgi:hypothetical protein